MSTFTVISIIDGDTFEVSPQWKRNGQTGSRVRPTGYDAPELHARGGQAAKDKLTKLIQGERVDMRSAHRVDRGRLARWAKRLVEEAAGNELQFHPVRLAAAQAFPEPIEIELASGHCVRVPHGFSEEDLRRVLVVLGTAAC